MDLNRARSIGVICALVAIAAASICLPAVADAALVPGTPVTPAPGVPSHGRAWELTTPPDPTGLQTYWSEVAITPDGARVSYRAIGLPPGYPSGGPLFPPVISVRGPSGWNVAQEIGPALVQSEPTIIGSDLVALGGDGTALWLDNDFSLYRENRPGQFEKLASGANFIAASSDLQRVLFISGSHFLPADATRVDGRSIYERDGSSLRLLDVDVGGALISNCGSTQPRSRDARRVYFNARPNCEQKEHLYVAEPGTGVRKVSEQGTVVGIARDGSSMLFKTVLDLSPDDGDLNADLYRYDPDGEDVTLVSGTAGGPDLTPMGNPDAGGPVGAPADVGSGWVSPAGSRAYYFAAEVTGPDEVGPTGIYLTDANGVHRIAATATTSLRGVSADGRYALLISTEPLAAGDGDGLADAYRYDAVTGDFTRVSQGPLGGNGAFAAAAEQDQVAGFGTLVDFRAMSLDGSRIVFTTAERLVPEDANGLTDIYEWANGDVGLVSSGVGKFAATLITSTPDGATVLFRTSDVLLPSDRDGDGPDFYAARIGGGFPEAPPTPDPCPCREPASGRRQVDDVAGTSPTAGRIALSSIDAAARRQIARSGWIELVAEVPGSGRLSAEARAKLGRRTVTVASTAVQVAEPGPVQLRMRLSKAARAQLDGGKGLSLRLRVGLAGDPGAASATKLQLKGRR